MIPWKQSVLGLIGCIYDACALNWENLQTIVLKITLLWPKIVTPFSPPNKVIHNGHLIDLVMFASTYSLSCRHNPRSSLNSQFRANTALHACVKCWVYPLINARHMVVSNRWTGLNLFISHDFYPIKCCKSGYSNYLTISCIFLLHARECTWVHNAQTTWTDLHHEFMVYTQWAQSTVWL